MQTQTETVSKATKPETVEDLDRQIAAKKTEAEKLKEAAERAKAEAERAETAAQREPTVQSDADARVAHRKALNAQATFEKFDGKEIAPLRAARQRLLDDAERDAIDAETSYDKLVKPEVDGIESDIEAFVASLDARLARIGRTCIDRNHHATRAGALGMNMRPVKLGFLVDSMNERLREKLVKQSDAGRTHFRLVLGGSPNSPNIHLELDRPLAVPSHSL